MGYGQQAGGMHPTGMYSCNCMCLYKFIQERPMAFAVLSNDSDFCVMRSNRFIPDLESDLEDSLGLRRGLWDDPGYTQQPILNLVVDVVTPDRVAAALGVSIWNRNCTDEHFLVPDYFSREKWNLLEFVWRLLVEGEKSWKLSKISRNAENLNFTLCQAHF